MLIEVLTFSSQSEQVFSHFVFGFPTNWEEYAENCLEKERSNKDDSTTLGRDKLSTDSGSNI